MGRLRKARIDMIVKLRRQQYTQVETAEQVGVHLKTVQKYDPLRRSRRAAPSEAARGISVEDLSMGLANLTEWVECIRATLSSKLHQEIMCPLCFAGDMEMDDDQRFCVCSMCKYKMPTPLFGKELHDELPPDY